MPTAAMKSRILQSSPSSFYIAVFVVKVTENWSKYPILKFFHPEIGLAEWITLSLSSFLPPLAFQKSVPKWDLSKPPPPTMAAAGGLRFFLLFALLHFSLFYFSSFNPPSLQVPRPSIAYISPFLLYFYLILFKISGYQRPLADLNKEEVRILSDFQSSVQQCVVRIMFSFSLIAFISCFLFD